MSNALSKSKYEWKEYRFSEMLVDGNISYGIVQPGAHTETDSVPIIRVNNIKNGNIDSADVLKVASTIEEKYQRTRLSGGELLITVVGSVGECAIVPTTLAGWNVARAVSVARIKENFDKRFVKYVFKTEDVKFQMYGNTNDTVQPTLNLSSLKEIKLILPPLPEQRAIAGVLSSLDDKIDLLHRQNKTLDGMAEALWRKMFVEEADPGWKKGKLGDMIITIESGRRPKGGIDPGLQFGIPSIGAENIIGIGNYEHNKTKYVSEEFYYKMNSGKVQDYDILIYKDGAYIGRKSMFARGFPFKQCCVNEHVFILRTKDINTQIFLYFLLDQEELEQLNANSAQPGLNQESMKSFEIFIPDEKYIEKFGIETKAIIDKIFFNSIQIRTLSKIRDTLLPKLMSGEIRIKNAEKFIGGLV